MASRTLEETVAPGPVAAMTKKALDIAVVGGGPAGCIAAMALADVGFEVAVLAAAPGAGAIEGLSARVLAGLRFAGCESALATVGPAVARAATWNGQTTSANSEHLVDRILFDRAIRRDAAARGVMVLPSRVSRLAQGADGWQLWLHGCERNHPALAAAFLVDARGRAAPGPYAARSPATTILAQPWRLPRHAASRTAVASFRDGWAWFAALPEGRATLQIALASRPGTLPKRGEMADFFAARRSEISEAGAWLAGGHPASPITARSAAPMLAACPVVERMIRVGDAAAAIDPLSGHGLFEAVGSALAAAAVVNTVLRRPRNAALARAFYRDRVEHAFRRHARHSRDVYAGEERWPEAQFWSDRRAWRLPAPGFDNAPSGAEARITERPVIENGYVVRREVVVTADDPRGVWQVDGVQLVPLMQIMPECHDVGAAAARLGQKPEAVRNALGWLDRHGLLPRTDMSQPRGRI